MPKEVAEKTIDDHKYLIGQMTTTKQLKLLARLNRILLGPIGNLAGDTDKEVDLNKLNLDIKGACNALAENLDEETVLRIVKDLLEPVLRDGQKIEFDTDFQGEMKHLFKVVKASMEEQFGDFFEDLTDGIKSVAAAFSRAKRPSTGSSGGPS